MPKIIDIIDHQSAYGVQRFLVLDEMPKRIYKRYPGGYFISNDSGFYDFLQGTEGKGEAFAGREFFITLDDGNKFHCQGRVWASGHGGNVNEPVESLGVSTVAELQKCYVFSSCSVSQCLIDEWLETNRPSRNYRKYDPRETLEYLDSVFTNGTRKICRDRARQLRRRGIRIFVDANGQRSWSPYYERRKAEIITRKEMD